MRDGLLHLALEAEPGTAGEELARAHVQVDAVEQGTPDVVLALVVGVVAHAHGPCVLVSREMVEDLLGELGLATDPVHHLQRGAVLHLVGDEVEEAVRLEVEPERVEAPQREGGVAHPAVAVVPVAFAAGSLRQ